MSCTPLIPSQESKFSFNSSTNIGDGHSPTSGLIVPRNIFTPPIKITAATARPAIPSTGKAVKREKNTAASTAEVQSKSLRLSNAAAEITLESMVLPTVR